MVTEGNRDIDSQLKKAFLYELLLWLEEQNRILEERRLWREWDAEEDESEWEETFEFEWRERNR